MPWLSLFALTLAVLLLCSMEGAVAEYKACGPGELCLGPACFMVDKTTEAHHLPCKVCRCVPRESELDLAPGGHVPCPIDQLRPKWVWYKHQHQSVMFPTRCNMVHFNQTHMWELFASRGVWIALVGDSLIRSTYIGLLSLFLPKPIEEYTSFAKEVYHNDHLICCRGPKECWGEIRDDKAEASFVDMVNRNMRQGGVSCLSWQWGPQADKTLVKLAKTLAANDPAPAAIAINAGIHNLKPGHVIPELDGMEAFLRACGAFDSTQCIVQTVAHTGYNRTDADVYKHLRLRQYIAAYNAGVVELIHMYRTAKYVDVGRLTRSPLVQHTMSGDRLHYLRDPKIFGPLTAQAILNLLQYTCEDCLTIEALP